MIAKAPPTKSIAPSRILCICWCPREDCVHYRFSSNRNSRKLSSVAIGFLIFFINYSVIRWLIFCLGLVIRQWRPFFTSDFLLERRRIYRTFVQPSSKRFCSITYQCLPLHPSRTSTRFRSCIRDEVQSVPVTVITRANLLSPNASSGVSRIKCVRVSSIRSYSNGVRVHARDSLSTYPIRPLKVVRSGWLAPTRGKHWARGGTLAV
jgi:hypothetical protein